MRVPDEEYYNIMMREFRMLEGLGAGHPNIIKVHDIFYSTLRKKMQILMEFAGDGYDLKKLISISEKSNTDSDNADSAKLTETSIKTIMKQLLSGISFLHKNRICHRDIKPGNIFVTKDHSQLKILDFNVAITFKHDPECPRPTMFGVTGEEQFSAPELSSGQKYD
jgi:serine/threonine protein kinase